MKEKEWQGKAGGNDLEFFFQKHMRNLKRQKNKAISNVDVIFPAM